METFNAAAAAKEEPPGDPGLKPPQFSLRTLMLAISLLGLFFAWIPLLPPTVTFLVILASLAIFAHLAGAHLGSQLNASAARARATASIERPVMPPIEPRHFAKITGLSARRGLGWPLITMVALGIIAGAIGGVMVARHAYPELAALEHCALAAITFAALGGLSAFLVGGFVQTAISGILEATRPDEYPPKHRDQQGAPPIR